MGQFDRLLFVGTFTADQKRAKAFFTEKIGLSVRAEDPSQGYLELGANANGPDASLVPWQPVPGMGAGYEAAKKRIGEVTGIGFSTNDLEKTLEAWRRKGVKAEMEEEAEEGPFAHFEDPDGNTFFATGPRKPRDHKPGVTGLAFVTIVAKDTKRSAGFFTNALGMTGAPTASGRFTEYRLAEEATAVMPFTPDPAMYDDASEAAGDLAHLGEDTNIVFTSPDIQRAQAFLMSRGVRFKRKAEASKWGGWEAEFYDADDNIYWLSQPAPAKRPSSK